MKVLAIIMVLFFVGCGGEIEIEDHTCIFPKGDVFYVPTNVVTNCQGHFYFDEAKTINLKNDYLCGKYPVERTVYKNKGGWIITSDQTKLVKKTTICGSIEKIIDSPSIYCKATIQYCYYKK